MLQQVFNDFDSIDKLITTNDESELILIKQNRSQTEITQLLIRDQQFFSSTICTDSQIFVRGFATIGTNNARGIENIN